MQTSLKLFNNIKIFHKFFNIILFIIFIFFSNIAYSQYIKIGFVNTERILRDSEPAKISQKKIESEFKQRDDELQKLSRELREKLEEFDRESTILSDHERMKFQRDLSNLDNDLQRKRREFQEDFNRRRNEEFSVIVSKANETIKRIAQQEDYDLIIQDAVTVNPKIDITEKVMITLSK
ncbi:Chaperone protein Skp [Candidatus Kinetoplastibacterium sorsogonicusi]|uniref:Chaperone protein Skp n=1 Tax=Candidatus Kinetoplastidibacterium kentomonadis TaxID=1576550 RepID=A0A3Q8EU91_9PROT|nr:OmpH family outer membrane protein [Candidatus Kinetoplastibacterium sorsogonicusi]AWD32432.1 Chaperone protein Skp [Candidatus Kinetoplastibacterium sorsogonicusi]